MALDKGSSKTIKMKSPSHYEINIIVEMTKPYLKFW